MLVVVVAKLVLQAVIMNVDQLQQMMPAAYVVVMDQMTLVVAVLRLVLQAVIMPVDQLPLKMNAAYAVVMA